MTTDRPATASSLDPAQVMSVVRLGVGALSWSAPSVAWRVFGMGTMPPRG